MVTMTRVYSEQQKAEAVQVASETSAREASRLTGIGVTSICKWARAAGVELVNTGNRGRVRSSWSLEQQAAAVERSKVVGLRPAAAEVGCSPSLLSVWRKRAGVSGFGSESPHPHARLRSREFVSAWCELELAAAVRARAEADGVEAAEVVRRALVAFVG